MRVQSEVSRRRRASIDQNEKEIGHLRGPHGFRLCRFCKREVMPPRKTFCSDACVHEWKLRSSSKYLRKFIYERDLGKCAKCGTDTRYVRIELEDAAQAAMKESGRWYWDDHPLYLECLSKWQLTVKEAKKSLWEADHIIEVADGGGESDLANFQTLCIPCHKVKSAAMRAERARQLREARRKRPII